jgi:hypothetical protein
MKKAFVIFLTAFTPFVAFGACTSGHTLLTGAGTSFMAPVSGSCEAPGYRLITIPDEYELFYSGMVIGNEVTLCSNGRMVNGTCSSYGTGDCASGYYDLATNADTFGAPTNEVCSTPYSAFSGTTRCDHNPGDTCVTIATPTIDVTWYNQNNVLETTTCYYGDMMTLPTTPTREGYTFNGWTIRQ